MKLAVVLFSVAAMAQTPTAVLDLLRAASQVLTEQKPEVFMDQFDDAMPGYKDLEANVTALTALGPVSSTLEIARDSDGLSRREIDVEWLLRVGALAPKRATLKLTLERRDGKWHIVALDRLEFFRPNQ
jgi:hypothetical protein